MFKTASIKVGVKIKPNKKEKAIVSYEKNNLKNRSINLIVQSNEESKKFEIDSIHDANVSK